MERIEKSDKFKVLPAYLFHYVKESWRKVEGKKPI